MNNLDYGIIGNCTSSALISKYGSLDWCCLPEFDSSSIFAKILDEQKGGSFEVLVSSDYKIEQSYVTRTNILRTTFSSKDGVFELLDFMPRYKQDSGAYYSPPDIIRYLKVLSGKPSFKVKYDPRLEYAQYPVKTGMQEGCGKNYTTKGPDDSVYLYTD